ncbi:MAG: hypothetical protein KAY24_12355 [Candidatus Eisenbacteria sp.]|nr:hypothetical protein [Candidatus Eisenbacteria bacterium]
MDPFDDCLRKGRLKKVEPDAERVASELATAKEELERARTCYIGSNWDEVATQAYFAMYRCARAGINSRGYRDTNLYGLCVALQRLFVDEGTLQNGTITKIREAKDIKDAVYGGHRASHQDARSMLQGAQVFAKAIFSQLTLPGFDAAAIELTIPERPDPGRSRINRPQRRSRETFNR